MLDVDTLAPLREQVRGAVVAPSEPGYEAVRVPFNAMHADRPDVVVRCAGTADVVAAVNFARATGLELTVRGGGHSIAGLSSAAGGIVLDLSPMRAVVVDSEARVARVQGGAVLGDVDTETQLYGLATPLGSVSETGVAGLTLGGGYGWLRRNRAAPRRGRGCSRSEAVRAWPSAHKTCAPCPPTRGFLSRCTGASA